MPDSQCSTEHALPLVRSLSDPGTGHDKSLLVGACGTPADLRASTALTGEFHSSGSDGSPSTARSKDVVAQQFKVLSTLANELRSTRRPNHTTHDPSLDVLKRPVFWSRSTSADLIFTIGGTQRGGSMPHREAVDPKSIQETRGRVQQVRLGENVNERTSCEWLAA